MYKLSESVVGNTSYCSLNIEQCPSQCCDLSVDDVRIKYKDEPNTRQGAQDQMLRLPWASYFGETGRNLNTRLTEDKLATRNGDANNHISVHHQLTHHYIDELSMGQTKKKLYRY